MGIYSTVDKRCNSVLVEPTHEYSSFCAICHAPVVCQWLAVLTEKISRECGRDENETML